MKKAQAEKEPTFEAGMAQLDEIVRRLESGEETLDDSVALYETGMKLSLALEKRLRAAEQRFETLQKEQDETASGVQEESAPAEE